MNIVLAHGILGFNKIPVLGVEYFNGVKAHLEEAFRAKVLVTKVSPIGSIAERAAQLQAQIDAALGGVDGLNPAEKVNIIAHSMGGLDARQMLSDNLGGIADSVATLTTVGTPHLGSPVADLVYSPLDGQVGIPVIGHVFDTLEKKAEQALSDLDITNGLRDLTTDSMKAFNQAYPDNSKVKYFCVAGKGRGNPLAETCLLLLPAHAYMRLKTEPGEPNDGVVALSSAYRDGWEVIGEPWPFDHFEEVGHNLDTGLDVKQKASFHFGLYDQIVVRLQLGGY
jgi:triacylglycerol lipase